MTIVYVRYRTITFSLPGNLVGCVKKGIVGYVLNKMEKGEVFLRRQLALLPLYQCTVFILIHIPSTLRNLYTDTVTR